MKKVTLISLLMILAFRVFSQDQILITDSRIPATDTVWVFIPETYDDTLKYPVVYMLHGYSSDFRQWDQIMDAQQYADNYQMIIVCPDGFYNSWYFNSPLLENSQYADFFFKRLIPEVEKDYGIDINNRFITGLSMGGHGAFHLFLSDPDSFRSAGSTSGVMDLRNSSGLFELTAHLGEFEMNKELWYSFSAVGNINKFKETGKELVFDCGTEDPFYQWNNEFYELCLESKLPITFISRPGKHDWEYWKRSIKTHFEFFETKVKR